MVSDLGHLQRTLGDGAGLVGAQHVDPGEHLDGGLEFLLGDKLR